LLMSVRQKRGFSDGDPTDDTASKIRRLIGGGSKSSRICRHFAKGYCQLGDQCGFSHNPEAISSFGDPTGLPETFAQQSGRQAHEQWAQGGSSSQYVQPSTTEFSYNPYVTPTTPQQFSPHPQTTYVRPSTLPEVYNPYGTTPTYTSGAPPPGYSPYPVYTTPMPVPVQVQVTGSSSGRKSTTLCRHFGKGFCRLGETCLFAHTPQAKGEVTAGISKSRCRHWARGHCNLQTQCRFSHDGEPGKGATAGTTSSSSSSSTSSSDSESSS